MCPSERRRCRPRRAACKAHESLAEALYEADPAHANLNRVVTEIEQAIGALDSLDAGRNDAKTFRLAGGYYWSGATTSVPPPTSVPHCAAGSRRGAYERSVSALRRALTIIESRSQGAAVAADAYRVLSAAYAGWSAQRRDRRRRSGADAGPVQRDRLPAVGGPRFCPPSGGDEAAVALMTGVMVTENRALRDELVDLYRQGLDPLGCALVNTREGAAINPSWRHGAPPRLRGDRRSRTN
jgi:hypothetical protein